MTTPTEQAAREAAQMGREIGHVLAKYASRELTLGNAAEIIQNCIDSGTERIITRATAEKDERIKELEPWKAVIIESAPELEEEGVENFSGYFAHWDDVIKHCQQAWETPMGYSQDPLELITQIINERDDLRADLVKVKEALADAISVFQENKISAIGERVESWKQILEGIQ